MPELPEVETIKKGLQKTIAGKIIVNVKILHKKSFQGNKKNIINKKVIGVDRRAKLLIIKLSGNKYLLIHLKMTGQLIYRIKNKELRIKNKEKKKSVYNVDRLPIKYTRVIFEFNDGSKLFFNDLRLFGWIRVVGEDEMRELKKKFGPEPFDKEFTLSYLKEIFAKTSRVIKLVLLDQAKIAGVGNIYANEALFKAGILPARQARRLRDYDIRILRKAIIKVLKKGIKYNGSTASDDAFRNIKGKRGRMQYYFKVYGRDKEKCFKCKGKIKRIKLGGRGTFYCPKCQK